MMIESLISDPNRHLVGVTVTTPTASPCKSHSSLLLYLHVSEVSFYNGESNRIHMCGCSIPTTIQLKKNNPSYARFIPSHIVNQVFL